jgi:type IV pilus assembly protein PilE
VKKNPQLGFTLIELMVAVVIVGLLTTIALPSYRQYAIRASRMEAQAELLQLASLQEKIFLNSNSYAFGANGVTAAYTGTQAGGLGRTSGRTNDGRYELTLVTLASSMACTGAGATATASGAQAFVVMATPVSGGSQVGDGNICVSESGKRLWGLTAW